MRMTSWSGLILLCGCVALAGCSSPADRYKAELKNAMKGMNDLHYLLVKDKDNQNKAAMGGTFKMSTSEYMEILDRLQATKTKLDEAAPYDDRIKEKVLRQYSPALESIITNVTNAKNGLKVEPGSGDIFKRIDDICKAYESLERPDKDMKKSGK